MLVLAKKMKDALSKIYFKMFLTRFEETYEFICRQEDFAAHEVIKFFMCVTTENLLKCRKLKRSTYSALLFILAKLITTAGLKIRYCICPCSQKSTLVVSKHLISFFHN